MNTELNDQQKENIRKAKKLIKTAADILNRIDAELFALGSFPESPVGHTAHELKMTVEYMDYWITEGLVI